jgi:hypothetical protein
MHLFRKSPALALCLLVLCLFIAGSLMGQLNQSGGPGSAVGINAGSNLIGKVGIDQTTAGTTNAISEAFIGSTAIASGNGIAGAGVQRVTIASDNTAFSVNATIAAALPAGTNVIGHVINDSGLINTIPKTLCGNNVATGSILAAVPTSATLLTSAANACVVAAIFNNPTSGALSASLSDNTGTPINALLTFSIPPFSSVVEVLYGVSFNLGVKWAASGAGMTGAVVAYQ